MMKDCCCFLFFMTVFIIVLVVEEADSIGVIGQRETCDNEGEPIALDNIDRHKCYSCICKNGFVECQKSPICPEIKGCYMIELSEEHCCPKCKGCYYKGVYHESNEEWVDPDHPCRAYKCLAGVVTKYELKCHITCKNAVPPAAGTCCATCPDCKVNGHAATDYKDVSPGGDLCVKCRCVNGSLICSKKACPVLQCNKNDQEHKPGECCPTCKGSTTSPINVPRVCVLASKVYKEGDTMTIDQCTRCKCVNQTSVCERENCLSSGNCNPMHLKRTNSCCKECKRPEILEAHSQCTFNGETYKEGQAWSLDSCTLCKCQNGLISCVKTRCNDTLFCPFGTHLVQKEGECCKKCEENRTEGTCMVFGDPHYKTFDGKMYTFQGIGKYQLISDCSNHTFSIRVTNDFSSINHSSTITKRIRIKYGTMRINLGQRFRTRVNGDKINLSFPYRNKNVAIEKQPYNMLVTLKNNVKILWNGYSFLEVTVPIEYKNKLCGLCGNFNMNVQDDFKVRKGGIVNEANLSKFGMSWCMGKDCARQVKQLARIKPCKMKARRQERNPCKYLTYSALFNECNTKLNYLKYYTFCLKDMCDCPMGKCYCESLTAYAQECQRLGVDVQNWQIISQCTLTNNEQQPVNLKIKQPAHNKRNHQHHQQQQQQQQQQHNQQQSKKLFSEAFIEEYVHKYENKKSKKGKEPMIH